MPRSPRPVPPPPLHPFEEAVATFLRREDLLREGDTVVVALSGGADSTALILALVAAAAGPGPRVRPVAAHLDHGLRKGSASEARAAGALVRSLGVPFRSARAGGLRRGGGGSVEAAARAARYAFLAGVARREKARAVAVAHHRDDRVETVLHRLLQGGALRGLAGIPLRRPLPGAPRCEVVRPLFEQDRAAILAYLEDRGVPWTEDPSNRGAANARARLRSSVLPAVTAAYPHAAASLLRLGGLAREASDLLDGSLREAAAGLRVRGATASLPREAFEGRSEEGIRRLLGRLMASLDLPRRDPPLSAVRRVAEALAGTDGKVRRVPMGGGAEVEVAEERLRLRVGGKGR